MGRYAQVAFSLPLNKLFTYLIPSDTTTVPGVRVVVPFGRRRLTGAVVDVTGEPAMEISGLKEIHRVIDERPLFDETLLRLARWMSKFYMCSLGEALFTMLPGGRREVDSLDLSLTGIETTAGGYALAGQQTEAIKAILEKRKGAFYLRGVTGSGKTEVFFRVAKQLLEEGAGVIYLVPEISLIHQVVDTFVPAFGDRLAVLHSGMSPSQRLREWIRLADGRARIVVGARSAVFAPVQKLGLIVLDEEHEGSYKAGRTPRYHTRQVAYVRCRNEGALLVMGSATPSAEAFYRMEKGDLVELSLPQRLSGGRMPRVEIVDMRRERSCLSGPLVEAVKEVHGEKRQTILFLNRRGFAHLFHCRSCGFEMKCRRCAVSLTFHKNKNRMMCHYCGFQSPPPTVCPDCHSLDIGYAGYGTERIEEEIRRRIPEVVVQRIDTDSVKRKRDLHRLLRDFRKGKIDLLLGTQMVAKGLNFPGVKLVGIVSVDFGLQLPDFRALERTFSLVVQVSGRAGRMTPDGRVILQTLKPDDPVLKRATHGDLDDFFREELRSRERLQFPPCVRFIRIVVRGKHRVRTGETADRLGHLFQGDPPENIEALGPVECPIAVIAGNYRFHIIFRSRNFPALHRCVSSIMDRFKAPKDVYIEIDVDPLSLL
jgi:primosomal protein N' (replication factor Y)